MRVFQLKNNNLNEISEESFDRENAIQRIVEKNLDSIFPDLEFLKTEYTIDDYRLDTIAFDTKKRSFVIIEYKKIQNQALIGQGEAYLETIRHNKDSVVLLYDITKKKHLKASDINWDKMRVIFISPEYTNHQKKLSNSDNREFYKIKKYQNGTIILTGSDDSQSLGPSKSTKPRKIPSKYTEKDYLGGKYRNACVSKESKKIWNQLKKTIENTFKDVEFKQKKVYAGYYLRDSGSSICTLEARKSKIILNYSTRNMALLETSEFVEDVSKLGNHGIGDFRSSIKNTDDIARAIPFIRAVYGSKK